MATTKINASQIVGTAGDPGASEVVKLDSSRNVENINNLTASYFKGDGSGLTGISSDSIDITGSSADADMKIVLAEILGDGVGAGADTAFYFNPSSNLLTAPGALTMGGALGGASTISGSSTVSGHALDVETTADLGGKLTVVGVSDLDGGIDVNASNFTVSTAGAVVAESTVSGAAGTFDALAGTSLALQSGGITAAGAIAGATTVSGSGQFSMSHIDLDGTLNAGGKVTVVGVSDLDGGIDVNASKFTVSTAGAVVADSTVSGAAGTFDALAGTSLALQSGGITAAGAIAGATTLAMGGALTGATTIAASSNVTAEGIVSGAAGTFDALAGTSLALQSGGITAAGAIAGATSIDASGDLTVGSITNSNFSVSSAGAVSGALGLSGLSLDIEKGAAIDGDLVAASASFSTLYGAGAAQLASTLLVEGAVTLSGVADAGIAVGSDSLYFLDSDGLVKSDTVADIMQASTRTTGRGIQASNGQLFLSWQRETFLSSSMTFQYDNGVGTASLPSAPLSGAMSPVGGGAMVFLNGQLQRSGSGVYGDAAAVDIHWTSNTAVCFNTTIDANDVVEVLYLKA